MTWLDLPADHPFGITNLPYGVFSTSDSAPRVGTRIGDHVLDLGACAEQAGMESYAVWQEPNLNAFLALGRPAWESAREWIVDVLTNPARRDCVEPHLIAVDDVTMHLPIAGRRLRRLLCQRAPRHERRATLPTGLRATDAELEAPADRLPRALRNGRRLRHRRHPAERSAQASDRARAGLRTERPARHRGRAGLHRRRRHRAGFACLRCRCGRPPLRRGAAQRLERPRPAGVGVRPPRPVPRQVVRDDDRAVGHHDRGAAGCARAPARARPTPLPCPTCRVSRPTMVRARHTGSTSPTRSSGTARSSHGRRTARCTGRPRRWSPT